MRAPDDKDVLVKQFFVGNSRVVYQRRWSISGAGRVKNGEWQWQFSDNVDRESVALAVAIFEKSMNLILFLYHLHWLKEKANEMLSRILNI